MQKHKIQKTRGEDTYNPYQKDKNTKISSYEEKKFVYGHWHDTSKIPVG